MENTFDEKTTVRENFSIKTIGTYKLRLRAEASIFDASFKGSSFDATTAATGENQSELNKHYFLWMLICVHEHRLQKFSKNHHSRKCNTKSQYGLLSQDMSASMAWNNHFQLNHCWMQHTHKQRNIFHFNDGA